MARARRLGGGVLVAVMVAVVMAGCASSPTSVSRINAAVDAYDAGRFDRAATLTESILESQGPGELRDATCYVHGIACYRAGRLTEAESSLLAAARSSDNATAGRAQAMLGVIRLDQGRARDAATLFEASAEKLDGHLAQRALAHATAAQSRGGYAGTFATSPPGLAPAATAQNSPRVCYVIQAGAFRDRSRATRAKNRVLATAREHGLDPVRVVRQSSHNGGRLYLVQIGGFTSEADAHRARQRLQGGDYIIATAAVAEDG